MRRKHTIVGAAIAAAIALNFSATAADAAHGDDLVSAAHRIDGIARELKDEFRIHYKHLRAYRHLMADIDEVICKARHIDDLAHDAYSSLRHIKADLIALDRLAHHMHDVVDAAEDDRYGGHVHGDTRHVHCLLDSLNRSIHSMTRMVERMANPPRCDYDRGHHGGYDRDPRHGRSYSYTSHRGHGRSGVSYSYSSGRGLRISFSTGRH